RMIFDRGPRARHDLGIARLEIEWIDARLLDIPWGFDEQLDAILLGVAKVDRPCDPVVGGVHLGNAGLALDPRVEAPEIRQRIRAQRDLVDLGVVDVASASLDENDLVVLPGIARQEHEPPPARLTAVGLDEAERAAIEVAHLLEILHIEAQMAE